MFHDKFHKYELCFLHIMSVSQRNKTNCYFSDKNRHAAAIMR